MAAKEINSTPLSPMALLRSVLTSPRLEMSSEAEASFTLEASPEPMTSICPPD